MEFKQAICLKSIAVNNNSALFKIEVNGEERIFFGKQSGAFNKAYSLEDKLYNSLKVADSFQKTYIVDKGVSEGAKKDVIIPCAVSADIVQLGDSLFSLSKETNNEVLYLLYTKRIINKYVDDKSKLVVYDIDKTKYTTELQGEISDIILRGKSNSTGKVDYGLIDNFNKTILSEDGRYKVEALEKESSWTESGYKPMPGLIESLIDNKTVSTGGEMPYNLIYEYGTESQYENDQSNVYTDYIHLKNSLSPFFNVEVTDNNEFKLWRKYNKIDSTDEHIWMSYTLDLPKTVESISDESPKIKCGNTTINNLASISGSTNLAISDQGFTLHVTAPKEELVDKYLAGHYQRINTSKNQDYRLQTAAQLAKWLVENSGNKAILNSTGERIDTYPSDIYFDISSSNNTLRVEAVKNYNSNLLEVKVPFNCPAGFNLVNASADSLHFNNIDTHINGNPCILELDADLHGIKDSIINWELAYEFSQPVEEEYEQGAGTAEFFRYGYRLDNEVFATSIPGEEVNVTPATRTNNKSFFIELLRSELQFSYLRRALDTTAPDYIPLVIRGELLQYPDSVSRELFVDKSITLDQILAADIPDDVINYSGGTADYTAAQFQALDKYQQIKYIISRLYNNYFELASTTASYYNDIKNYHLSKVGGNSFNDLIYCLFYHISGKGLWNNGYTVELDNLLLLPYSKDERQVANNFASTIKYQYSPLDLKLGTSNNPLYSDNDSVINLFATHINGKPVANHKVLEADLVAYLSRDSLPNTISVDLAVAFKDKYQQDCLIISLYINGELIHELNYPADSVEYQYLKGIQLGHVRLWFYSEFETEFAYQNVSMWNYPIGLVKIQQMARGNIAPDTSAYSLDTDINQFILDDTNGRYKQLFFIASSRIEYHYHYLDDNASINDKKLGLIKDFEFIERIEGINKLMPQGLRKSNLYTIDISNTGLIVEDGDDADEIAFKSAVTEALNAAVATVCSKVEPMNTKLFSVVIS